MNFLAVDFSLNSPGICLYNDKGKKYHFISYIKPKTGTKAEQRLQEEISLLSDVTLVDQPDFTNNETFSSAELLKVKRYDRMADDIINLVLQNSFDGDGFTIGFEGTSYGSNGGTNNMIDMAAGAAILKLKLLKTLNPEDIMTVAPTTIKKFAGKGNMSKLDMWEAFLCLETLNHSELFKFCQQFKGDKKIMKPLDDLVDAYFLLEYVSSLQTNSTSQA